MKNRPALAVLALSLVRRRSPIFAGAILSGLSFAACSDDTVTPVQGMAGSGATAGLAGAAGSATVGGQSASGSSAGGTAGGGVGGGVGGGNAGNGGNGGAVGTAGSGTAGGGGIAGNGGSAGTAGNSGNAGNGGNGGAVTCPPDNAAGAGGAGGDADAGLDPVLDADADGVPNCLDRCPADPSKTRPGQCGCGVADVDTDADGSVDCKDECPQDASKIAVGVCGCGLSDTANADADAAVDCKDACPSDPAKTTAGTCGCLPDSLGASCLAHRYSFNGTGTVATDSIAGAAGDGTIVGAQLTGTGSLTLAGGTGATDEQYVTLPAKMISAMGDSATIEAWVTWNDDAGDWQRIFDFGISDQGAGKQGKGDGYVFATPRAGNSGFRAGISSFDYTKEVQAGTGGPLLTAELTHVAVVLDGATMKMTLFQNGIASGTAVTIPPQARLATLNDANNWLGRSQYASDPRFAGTYTEVRIYSRALKAAEIAASFLKGADTL